MRKRILVFGLYLLSVIIPAYYFGIIVGKNKDRNVNKFKQYFKLMTKWIQLDADKVEKYLFKQGIGTISIYGVGDIGKTLFDQLKDSRVKVVSFLEARDREQYQGVPVVSIDRYNTKTDAIIVTPFLEYDQIKKELGKRVNCKIISIEEVIQNAGK